MSKVTDYQSRENALDPSKSFIVQAPAGSGKTELLTQRLLVLLANTKQAPEEVVAITFTRKAATEMRTRVYEALSRALQPAPELPHELKTWQLANNVLTKDRQHNWQLLKNPNRLQILTIDALCAKIAKSAPLLSHFGTIPTITEEPTELYTKAADAMLESLAQDAPWQSALMKLLLHLDNNYLIAQQLFIRMLSRRDQWLPYIMSHKNAGKDRGKLEQGLQNIIIEALTQVANAMPTEHQEELLLLANFAATILSETHPDSPICSLKNTFPSNDLLDQDKWLAIQELLLTKSGEWRKTVNKNCGFPSASDALSSDDKPLFKQMKDRMITLLSTLTQHQQFFNCLQRIALLPPAHYSQQQWEIIEALTELLPVLVAHLQILFREQNVIDFIAIAQGALDAFGDEDAPSDLALNLDYRIQHLLVDEFQDTSATQFRLLELLTAGWEETDGRTLFLVGDPMQSIYRFREADVGIFLRVKNHGIGQIKIHPITLEVNFRSQAGIVNWLNETFSQVFPEFENGELGAIRFSKAVAFSDVDDNNHVAIHALENPNEQSEADQIVQIIKHEQQQTPEATIAILVRSRSHLQQIVPILKKAKLDFQAIEIERLIYSPVVSDLFALTKALYHLGDRIAWLAILRAPWCGLTLTDLYAITQHNLQSTIWDNVQHHNDIQNLSEDGRRRVERIVPIINIALQNKLRISLRQWLTKTWQALGGPACLNEPFEINNAQAYFDILDEAQTQGDLKINKLEQRLQSAYIHSASAGAKIQVLTIHKAKGLEYDVVIMPSLEKKPAIDEHQLLLWLERHNKLGKKDLIFAPIKSLDQSHDPIYRYIRTQESIKAKNEITRLLYVAATRARRKLHLIGAIYKNENEEFQTPSSNSFLNILWPSCQQLFTATTNCATVLKNDDEQPIFLERLTSDWQPPDLLPINNTLPGSNKVNLNWQLQFSRQIGTVIHQHLQKLSSINISDWTQDLNIYQNDWRKKLLEYGVTSSHLDSSLLAVTKAVHNIYADQRAQWILSNSHQDSKSEFAISMQCETEIVHWIIDRTFIDQEGTRWIIDYKTTDCGDNDVNSFYTQAKQTYVKQLENYASYFKVIENRPIKLGLYFPMFCGWHCWDF